VTSIYFLLTSDSFSAWHKLKSEEVWHYYKGSPLTIYIINNETQQIESIKLGDPLKHEACRRQYAVKAGTWFCATTNGAYCFAGATVAPGFDFADFNMGDRKSLLEVYPHLRIHIEKFTRETYALDTTQTPRIFNIETAECDLNACLSHSTQSGTSSPASSSKP
jgi:predicted cupin superfamily sugar epimerase